MKYRFAHCELDTERHEFMANGTIARLEPQVFDLLAYLAGNPGRLITKDEIVAAIWDGRAISDSAITTRINGVRRAVGDDGIRQGVVATVPRRGFRWVVPVEMVLNGSADGIGAKPLLTHLQVADRSESKAPRTTLPTVGLVPFALQPADPSLDYLATGLTDEITTELGRYHTLAVLARYSTQQVVRSEGGDLGGLKALGATHGVRGTIQLRHGKLRIAVQLVQLASQRLLWAERYDIGREELLAMQDDVVSSIVQAIHGGVADDRLAEARSRPTESLDAYDCVLRGMALHRGGGLNNCTADDARAAIVWYDRAIDLDPRYARAHGWRACASVVLWPTIPEDKHFDECRAACRKALELDPLDAELHRLMVGNSLYQRRFDLGHYHLDRMRALNPNDCHMLIKGGHWLNFLGERDRAITNIELSMRRNPLHPPWYWRDAGIVLFDKGDYEGAWTALNLVPVLRHTDLVYRAATLVGLGELHEAKAVVARLHEENPDITLANLANLMPYRCYKRDQDVERLRDHVARAGLE